MFLNQHEIEHIATRVHEDLNVRKGVRLILRLMQATNEQSDGWAHWSPPSKSIQKLVQLLQTAGNLMYGTRGKISDADLRKAVAPIKAMVTQQRTKQKQYGNTFEFDVDEAMDSVNAAEADDVWEEVTPVVITMGAGDLAVGDYLQVLVDEPQCSVLRRGDIVRVLEVAHGVIKTDGRGLEWCEPGTEMDKRLFWGFDLLTLGKYFRRVNGLRLP